MKEAYFYKKENNIITCTLCPHYCALKEGQTGICATKKVINGRLIALNYGHLTAVNIDPIEKKPLKHFMPGTKTMSIGSYGCNFYCKFCQNHEIAKHWQYYNQYSPNDIVQMTLDKSLRSMSYTYNEPTVFYEFVYDTAKLAHNQGLKNILVTNGYINEAPLIKLMPYIDALNIDFKAYDNQGYKKFCGGDMNTILATIDIMKSKHIEVTFLIVPKLNDDVVQLEEIFKKLKRIKKTLCIHITRYFPRYLMSDPATDISLMLETQTLAKQYFEYVYLGNV